MPWERGIRSRLIAPYQRFGAHLHETNLQTAVSRKEKLQNDEYKFLNISSVKYNI